MYVALNNSKTTCPRNTGNPYSHNLIIYLKIIYLLFYSGKMTLIFLLVKIEFY